MKRIGLLGGTFDPIHNGHLHLAREALKKLKLNKVIFVPTRLSPLKKTLSAAPADFRYQLVRAILRNHRHFEVSRYELNKKKAFTVDTLRYFRNRFGKNTELYFLTGSDLLKDFHRWKNPNEILRLCHFVVVNRPGSAFSHRSLRGVKFLRIKPYPISSSELRKRLRKGESVQRWLPSAVLRLIQQSSWYHA